MDHVYSRNKMRVAYIQNYGSYGWLKHDNSITCVKVSVAVIIPLALEI